MAAQLTAWDTVLKDFVDNDPYFAKVVESQKEWAKRVGAYELTNAPDYAGAYRHYFGEPV
jgi:TRAP-type mannitol/chloroaromatic compound transport system substrate-binding protein